MRRNNLNFRRFLLTALIAVAINRSTVDARVYTEGGSFHQRPQQVTHDGISDNEQESFVNPYDSDYRQQQQQRDQLEGIVDELTQLRRSQEGSVVDDGAEEVESAQQREPNEAEVDELNKLSRSISELSKQQQQDDESDSESKQQQEPKKEKPVERPQKKGESEYVDFIAPKIVVAKQLKNHEFMEKRVADFTFHREGSRYGVDHLLSSSSNIVFMAFVTMCCVMSVVGVVGAAYYYKHVRAIHEDPFDDFTRYSPAGPPKLSKKGGGSKGSSGNFTIEKGDETLAYRAQLHHYQQTKQKIIGTGIDGSGLNGAGVEDDASDKSDDEADLEHNFSVYECPGLAPTGDIEVQNPNFVDSTTGGKRAPPQKH